MHVGVSEMGEISMNMCMRLVDARTIMTGGGIIWRKPADQKHNNTDNREVKFY